MTSTKPIDEAAATVSAEVEEEMRELLDEVVPALHASVGRLMEETIKTVAVLRPDWHEALAALRPDLFKRTEDDDDEEDDEDDGLGGEKLYRPNGPREDVPTMGVGGGAPATGDEDMPEWRDRMRSGAGFGFPDSDGKKPAWGKTTPRIM